MYVTSMRSGLQDVLLGLTAMCCAASSKGGDRTTRLRDTAVGCRAAPRPRPGTCRPGLQPGHPEQLLVASRVRHVRYASGR
jgi:hypothetical protein